ncbi:unnamed protein product [Spodoptera exigua]|nr:unnamed protein product [Spodoptera exigua]
MANVQTDHLKNIPPTTLTAWLALWLGNWLLCNVSRARAFRARLKEPFDHHRQGPQGLMFSRGCGGRAGGSVRLLLTKNPLFLLLFWAEVAVPRCAYPATLAVLNILRPRSEVVEVSDGKRAYGLPDGKQSALPMDIRNNGGLTNVFLEKRESHASARMFCLEQSDTTGSKKIGDSKQADRLPDDKQSAPPLDTNRLDTNALLTFGDLGIWAGEPHSNFETQHYMVVSRQFSMRPWYHCDRADPFITMARTALVIISFILAIVPCFCQRPFYAGLRPIGFPETPVATGIFDRFPDEPIPAQLNGDRNYANQLNALPQDNQPFFFLNKDKVAESLKNPQTYPQRPSIFNENNRNRL